MAQKYTITLPGNPALYQAVPLPENYELVGEIHRDGELVGGALAKIKSTGIYVQVNAGVVRSLDPREVALALAATVDIPDEAMRPTGGRPPAGQGIDWSQVDLTRPTSVLASELGVTPSSVSQQKKRYAPNLENVHSANELHRRFVAAEAGVEIPDMSNISSAKQLWDMTNKGR